MNSPTLQILLRRLALVTVVVGATIVLGYWAALAFYDGPRIAAYISDRLDERYGVALSVDEISRSYELRPAIDITGLRVANSDFEGEALVSADRLSFRLRPWTLLIDPVTLDEVDLGGLHVQIPTDGDGTLYWDPLVEAASDWFAKSDLALTSFSATDSTVESRRRDGSNSLMVRVENLDGTWPDTHELAFAARSVDADLAINRIVEGDGRIEFDEVLLGRQPGPLPVILTANGRIADKGLTIEAAGGNLLAEERELREPIRAQLSYGTAEIEIAGTMSADERRHVSVGLNLRDPGEGDRPPLSIVAAIDDPQSNWRFDDVQIEYGDREIAGNVLVEKQGDRRRYSGEATLNYLELPAKDDPAKDDEESDSDREALDDDDLLPEVIELADSILADYRLNITELQFYGVRFDDILLETVIESDAITATVENTESGSAQVAGELSLMRSPNEPTALLTAKLRNVGLESLLEPVDALEGVTGMFDGEVELRGTGEAVTDMLESAQGFLRLHLDGGSMPEPLAKKAAGELMATLGITGDDDATTTIHCATIDAVVENGRATAQSMLLDSGDFYMTGAGTLNLKDAALDISLKPHPRDASLVSAQTPFSLRGPLNDLEFDVDVSSGFASLLTPIEFGSSRDIICSESPLSFSRRNMPTNE